MKKLLTLLLALSSITAFSKPTVDSTKLLLYRARVLANPKNPKYKPDQAFATYNKLAQQGNSEAMNGLGMLYSQGIGTAVNDQQALNWFEKSANNGYARSWYNLALMYKGGIGTALDLTKAYQYYKRGADMNNPMCLYGQGYMLYKGYGCDQNYEQAAKLFKKGASLGDEGSYYMLGLCYRNGYGITINTDSAKYWLSKAMARGDQRAKDELANSSPENTDMQNVPNLQAPTSIQSQPVNLKTGFKQIKHHVIPNDMAGEYTGYVIKFDWSGKHIIGQSALKLNLERKDKILSGEWQEEGQQSVSISAILTDTAVMFNNTSYNKVDHYHTTNPLATEFKDSHLNLVKNKDTVYLTGTVRLYSTKFKELEKPEFIMLIRTGNKQNNVSDTAFNSLGNTKIDSVHFVAYPNPFTSNLKLKYTLKKSMWVSIMVSDLQTGRIAYRSVSQKLSSGDYDTPVYFNGQPGSYIVTLQYDNKVKSAIVFKQ
jgi:TPR repeat protein